MLACRLCLALGIDDPEQWLEDCPDRVYQVWEAYSQIEPWWGTRELLAQMVAALRLLLAAKCDKDVDDVMDNATKLAASWMPADWIDRPEPVDSIKEAEAKAQVYGN